MFESTRCSRRIAPTCDLFVLGRGAITWERCYTIVRATPHDPHVLTLSSFLINYLFSQRILPRALQVIKHCRRMGEIVILSDEDVVFQPHEIERSGLSKAVGDRVLIYVYKE